MNKLKKIENVLNIEIFREFSRYNLATRHGQGCYTDVDSQTTGRSSLFFWKFYEDKTKVHSVRRASKEKILYLSNTVVFSKDSYSAFIFSYRTFPSNKKK